MTTEAIATLQPAEAGLPLTSKQLIARLATIQDVMRHVMQKDQDYGVVPGTQKPTLYKPGAEKLCVTFRLAPAQPLIESIGEGGEIRYRVSVPILSHDGAVVAVGVGECSTNEEKYAFRRPVHINEYNAAPADQRREKWTRDGDVWQQVRVNPADVANTVLKMAHKRAYVHGVIMATAAGAIFTQDIEDLPDGVEAGDGESRRSPVQAPQRKTASAAAAPAGAGETIRVGVKEIKPLKGSTNGRDWTRYVLFATDGQSYSTFDEKVFTVLAEAKRQDRQIDLTFTVNAKGRTIAGAAIVEAEREPGAEG